MSKLMMTVASLALLVAASPVLAQSSSSPSATPPRTATPDMSMPNTNATGTPPTSSMPQNTAPMSSKDSTAATSSSQPASSDMSQSGMSDEQKPMHKTSHRTHHGKSTDSTKASGSKSTDNDAEQLNQQELGKLQPPS